MSKVLRQLTVSCGLILHLISSLPFLCSELPPASEYGHSSSDHDLHSRRIMSLRVLFITLHRHRNPQSARAALQLSLFANRLSGNLHLLLFSRRRLPLGLHIRLYHIDHSCGYNRNYCYLLPQVRPICCPCPSRRVYHF
jgi:hypothetical protein